MSKSTPDPQLSRLIMAGALICILFFGVLGGWAAFTNLASAAIAPGELGFDTSRQTVQHLEGGIVAEILVSDGDVVEPGDVLIKLDRTQPLAVYEQVKARYLTILATEARLRAERDAADKITFPAALSAPEFSDHAAGIQLGEHRLFETRRRTIEHQEGISRQRVLQLEEEIQGLADEMESQDEQIDLLRDESQSMQALYEKKMLGKQPLLALQREALELEGERARNRAAVAKAKQGISEQELRIIEIRNDRDSEVLAQLRELQGDILEINERMSAAKDVLNRTEIIAPIKGTVVGLTISTVSGVIASRQPLMDIVPLEERLLVKAYLDPKDIDVVRAGQTAFVRLTAFNQRNLLPIEGEVISVSADSLTEENSGARYYLARIALPTIGNEAFQGMEIYPGMQAEVMIQVGERSPLDYLLQPIKESMNRALRED